MAQPTAIAFKNETITRSKRDAGRLHTLASLIGTTNDPRRGATEIKRKFHGTRFPSQKLYSPLKYVN